MSPQQPPRPRLSVPHAEHRMPTGPTTAVVDPTTIPEDVQAIATALGLSVESVLRLFGIGARMAVIETRQDDKLRVDTSIGAMDSRVGTLISTIIGRRSSREKAILITAICSTISTIVLGLAALLIPAGYKQATVDAIEPAVRAESKVLTLDERMDASDKRHEATEEALRDIAGALDDNTRAILGLAGRIPEPDPTPIVVPKPKKKGTSG